MVISRSNYPSSGTHVGHWLGDNTSKWEHLKLNLIGMLEYNIFGYSYIGADTCGFFGDTTPEMCTRWMQLGAFNTYFRNHNGYSGINQDPAALGLDVAVSYYFLVLILNNLIKYIFICKKGGKSKSGRNTLHFTTFSLYSIL
jgi:alpha-glucosidase (family GH31 glycosyl hydrolase)